MPQNKPGITNLLTIYAALSTTLTTPQAVAEARGSLTTEQFKEELATLVMEHLKGIQVRRRRPLCKEK